VFLIGLTFTIFLSFSGLALSGYDFDLIPEGTNLEWNLINPHSPQQIKNSAVNDE
jgi:hypothetical protein